jgi:hypothetical protein
MLSIVATSPDLGVRALPESTMAVMRSSRRAAPHAWRPTTYSAVFRMAGIAARRPCAPLFMRVSVRRCASGCHSFAISQSVSGF